MQPDDPVAAPSGQPDVEAIPSALPPATGAVQGAPPATGESSSKLAWFIQNTSSGLVVGALGVTLGISLAALMYGGDLEPFLGRGIGLVLLGSAVLSLVVSALTSVPGMFASSQDAPAAVLGALSAALGAQLVG